jgi:hypothetical protein
MSWLFGPRRCRNCGRGENRDRDIYIDKSGLCDKCRVLNTGKGAPKEKPFSTGLEPQLPETKQWLRRMQRKWGDF